MQQTTKIRLKFWLIGTIGVILLAYLGVCTAFYFYQDRLIFRPAQISTLDLAARAESAGFEAWIDEKGEQVGWKSKDGSLEDALLVFGGNGGFGLRGSYYRERAELASGNWKVYLLEYTGYGNRPGKPSEASLTKAAIEAVDVLNATKSRIWLMGLSLGSGVACSTIRERADLLHGLILVTPFNSLVATASYHYPWLIVTPLMRARFDSEKNLANYRGPVAFLISEKDTTTPWFLGKKLFDGFSGKKQMWTDPDGNHDVSKLETIEWVNIVEWLQAKSLLHPIEAPVN